MLAVVPSPSRPSFNILDASINEGFVSIDRFEFQIAEELKIMRDDRIFEEGGYSSFEEYCEDKLSRWGGYRRVNQLIGAQMVSDTLKGTEFDGAIKRESHARPLLRLVKKPEKLRQAVAIACQNPEPTAADFKQAADEVEPPKRTKPKSEEQLFLKGTTVKITSQTHPRHGEKCVIAADPPNHWQQIVEFSDGERTTVQNTDLDAASSPYTPTRTPTPRTYTEEELQQEINRAIQEAKIGEISRLREQAEKEAQEQINAARAIANQRSVEAAELRQQIKELESLRLLEVENELLKQRIQDLENASEKRACQDWGHNTFTPEAAKVLNIQAQKVIENLEPDLDLRNLAKAPPKEKHREVLRLLGLSLANIALAMPHNNKLLESAAAMWGISTDQVAGKVEQMHKLPQAIASLRQAIQSNPVWDNILAVANKYPLIKQEVWLELSPQERATVDRLRPWKNPTTWDRCKYQPIEKFHLIYNGDRWLIVPPNDTEKFTTPANWLEAWGKDEAKEGTFALADNLMVAYNYHATVVEVNLENSSLRVRWQEREGKPTEHEWFFCGDLDQLRVVELNG